MVNKELLEVLACPKCKGHIELKDKFIICNGCKLAYPVIQDIPDMLIDDAWKLDRAKKSGFKHGLKL